MVEDRVVDGVILRTCRSCNEESDLASFERCSSCKHGRLYRCKACRYEAKGKRRRERYRLLRAAGVPWHLARNGSFRRLQEIKT